MPLHKRFWFVLILSLSVMLAACGGDDDSGDNDSSDNKDDTITLTQSATSGDGISISLPEGWFVDTSIGAGLSIANTDAVVDATSFEDNQVIGSVILLPSTGAEEETTTSILDGYVQNTLEGSSDAITYTFEPIETFDANGKSASIIVGSGTDPQQTNDLVFIIVAVEENYVLFSYLADNEQMAQFLETLRAIAGSVAVTPPAGDNADG